MASPSFNFGSFGSSNTVDPLARITGPFVPGLPGPGPIGAGPGSNPVPPSGSPPGSPQPGAGNSPLPSFPTGGPPTPPPGSIPGGPTLSGSLPYGTTPPGGGSYTGQQTPTSFADFPGQSQTQAIPTFDPTFTNMVLSMLGGQMGQGLGAFNQSTFLPTGGQTQFGQLTAPLNPVMQQLQSFMSGQTGPGGLPGVLPMWQSEMAAMQQPIQQNLTNLREQFGTQGALGSSELAGADMDYLSQVSADQMALLTQATQASLPQMLQTGQGLQAIDQSAITNAYQQYMQDLPQNNPLMGDIMSLAESSPGAFNKSGGIGTAVLGALPGMMSGAGSLASGLGALGGGIGGGAAGLGGLIGLLSMI